MPFVLCIEEVVSGTKGMDGLVLVFVVVGVTFSGWVAQDPSANRHAQTRQTPMDFFMSAVLSQTGTPRKQQEIAQSPQRSP